MQVLGAGAERGRTYGGSGTSRRRDPAEHRRAVADAAMRPAPPRSDMPSGPVGARGAESMGLRVGDDVSHDKFGEGVILELVGEGDKTEAVVHFRDVGREAAAARVGAAGEGVGVEPESHEASAGAGSR